MLTLTSCQTLYSIRKTKLEVNDMTNFQVHPIGSIKQSEEGSFIKIDPQYIPALQALNDVNGALVEMQALL